ncbi:MAG TPA: hypothetical protein VGR49_00750 [Actinomycetota bacterium]|jgi:hypothetical protein|nr:hypothetical protein [Actinomycetota bacterium]
MRPSPKALKAGVLAGALLVGACGGGGDSIAGTYNCGVEGETPDDSVIELREDGTLTITQPDGSTGEGAWSAEGDSGAFNPGTPEEDPFTIEGDNLVFADSGAPVRFVCTPES